jgi:hypothetical protein
LIASAALSPASGDGPSVVVESIVPLSEGVVSPELSQAASASAEKEMTSRLDRVRMIPPLTVYEYRLAGVVVTSPP